MNAEPKIEQATEEQPKSKRLSSLVWILVLWGGARLLSELSGTGWEKMFGSVLHLFGILPATVLLFLAAMSRKIAKQKIYRYGSLLVVLQSIALMPLLDAFHISQVTSDLWTSILQWCITCTTVLYSMLKKVELLK
jgi:cellulose synthase/poly-beta-1,6-N-acetylglucosamine synthase-like glycosyltransferase